MRRLRLATAILAGPLILATGRPSPAGEGLPLRPTRSVGLDLLGLEKCRALCSERPLTRKQIAGAVVLVARHGKVAYREAFGKQDAEAGAAMSPGSIFRIASMSKPVTSTAVMILADQGRLDLSDPISRYLPEFKFMKVAMLRKPGRPGRPGIRRRVRAGRCLPADHDPRPADAHVRTELPDVRPAASWVVSMPRPGSATGFHRATTRWPRTCAGSPGSPCIHQPGTAWEYGLNTDVLGRLVEVVSGQSLDAFLSERILKPLKMDDTHFVLPEAKRNRLAALYEPGKDETIVRTGDGPTVRGPLIYSASFPYRGNNGYFSGGAGLVSTADDYARFLQMLLNRGELDGVRILRPETVDAMTRPQTGNLPIWIGVHGPSSATASA